MMIINRSKAVLVESGSSGAGTVLDLPEARFAVNAKGELTHLKSICKDLHLPLDCSAFRFLSFDPCVIIANTDDLSIEQLGNLGWISINLMRDPFTSVQLHVLSHNLSVACGAVQHSCPEVWRQSYPLLTDGIPHDTPCQERAPLPLIEAPITEKEILAEERAHRFMRQTTAEYYKAADAEGNEMQTTAMYDSNGIFHRQELPVSVRDLSKVLSDSYLDADSNTTSSSNNPNSLGKGELCRTFKRTGECRFGDSCRFKHAASANAPAAAANLPAAVAMQDPEDDQMGVDLEEFTCGAGLGPGCTKTYKTCPSFWVKLGKKHQKAFVTPTSCRYCRKIKKDQEREPEQPPQPQHESRQRRQTSCGSSCSRGGCCWIQEYIATCRRSKLVCQQARTCCRH